MIQWTHAVLAIGMMTGVMVGCGGAPKNMPKIGAVTGKVTLDGQPLKKARIQFTPDSSRPSGAVTDDQGEYVLIFNEHTKGAAVGKHTVRINSGTAMEPEKLPAKYHVKSELTAEVKEGANPPINFDLKSK